MWGRRFDGIVTPYQLAESVKGSGSLVTKVTLGEACAVRAPRRRLRSQRAVLGLRSQGRLDDQARRLRHPRAPHQLEALEAQQGAGLRRLGGARSRSWRGPQPGPTGWERRRRSTPELATNSSAGYPTNPTRLLAWAATASARHSAVLHRLIAILSTSLPYTNLFIRACKFTRISDRLK